MIKNIAYQPIAQKFIDEAAKHGIKAWVTIPEFIFDTPEPLFINRVIKSS
jgi:predicted metal-dependent phosphotriesterase family hydrolase